MVIERAQNAVNNLKTRPRDERKTIAAGVAIVVVAALFLVWAVVFFKKIQGGGVDVDLSALQGENIVETIQQP